MERKVYIKNRDEENKGMLKIETERKKVYKKRLREKKRVKKD